MQRRNTQQRKLIYDILSRTDSHPTADWIYERVKRYIPNISLGTVYRNLKVLKDKGLILEISDGKQSRYDARVDDHYHFRCDACGNVYDIEHDTIEINPKVDQLRNYGFKVSRFNVEFYGICKNCARGEDSEKNN